MGPGRDGWKGCHEKKRKGADTIPHILRKDHPARRERTTKRGREKEWPEWRARARRKESSTVYDTTRFLGIPQFREPILQPPLPRPPSESTERVCSPSDLLYPPCGQISASQ